MTSESMADQRSLAEYDDESSEAALREIVSEPDMCDFGNDFMASGSPKGIAHAREVDDPDLLREYRELCADRLLGDYFAANPMVRERADDKYGLLERLDAMIERAEFPNRRKWPVDSEFVDFVAGLDTPSTTSLSGGRRFDRQGWERVWDACTVEDIRFVRRALLYAPGLGRAGQSFRDDLLATFLYYHGAEVVDDLFEVSSRGDGPSDSTVYENLEVVLDRLDPVAGAMAVYWIRSVTTNVTESGGGRYRRAERRINVSSDSTVTRERDRGGYENTTAHEVGHSLHHLYGFWVEGGDNTDNRGRNPDDWEWNVANLPHDKTSTAQDAFRTVVRQEWEKLRRGEVEPIEEYQIKNADELIAVAFECWVVDPARLAAEQPRMKRLFDAHFGRRDYSGMQSRLAAMPSPRRLSGAEGTDSSLTAF